MAQHAVSTWSALRKLAVCWEAFFKLWSTHILKSSNSYIMIKSKIVNESYPSCPDSVFNASPEIVNGRSDLDDLAAE